MNNRTNTKSKLTVEKEMLLPKPREALVPSDFYEFNQSDLIYDYSSDGTPIKLVIKVNFWEFHSNGNNIRLSWDFYGELQKGLIELLKGFFYYRFHQVSASYIATSHIEFLRVINRYPQLSSFPWDLSGVKELLFSESIKNDPNIYYCLKSFYSWGLSRKLFGFKKNVLDLIIEFKVNKVNSYETIFLRQSYMDPSKLNNVVEFIKREPRKLLNGDYDFNSLMECVLIQICFELAPRPSQLYLLDDEDLIFHSVEGKNYYALRLSMSKKRLKGAKEKRVRKVSDLLGARIKALIECKGKIGFSNSNALFITKKGNRFGTTALINKLSRMFKVYCGFEKGEGTILLRHNLGQSLADQGASAEVIADVLGHNSTLPSRAYIAATPKIAEIKTKALGKSNTYKNIIKMLTTGKLIEKGSVAKATWVKGMVGFQYIGEIGSCSNDQVCPKNPVYSCYSCNKFNPFIDGEHDKVLKGLEDNVQRFIDAAVDNRDLEYNRTVTQLENVILNVKSVINSIENGE